MTRILCIDATTEACSVALFNNDEITDIYQVAPRQHASLLLPLVDKLLSESGLKLNQLDGIGCLVGPGAFTGIRIGVSVAQGLAYGSGVPTIALSSLASMAQQAFDETDKTHCWCAIDARMKEVYFAHYQKGANGLAELVGEEVVIGPDKVDFEPLRQLCPDEQVAKIGSGWQAYQDVFLAQSVDFKSVINDRFPSAKASLLQAKLLLEQGAVLSPEKLQPVYLRNKVAEKKSNKK